MIKMKFGIMNLDIINKAIPIKTYLQNAILNKIPNIKTLLRLIISANIPTGISAIIFEAFIITNKVANFPPEKPFFANKLT